MFPVSCVKEDLVSTLGINSESFVIDESNCLTQGARWHGIFTPCCWSVRTFENL